MHIDERSCSVDAKKDFTNDIPYLRRKLSKFEKTIRPNATSKDLLHFLEIYIVWIVL
jgi:hypothetical protein